MPSPNEITVNQLSNLVGTPACPVIIDLCIDEDFSLDPRLIPGAFRFPFKSIEQLKDQLQGKRVVVYCQKGKKISQGTAAVLRCHGITVECLEGGVFAWRDAGFPLVPQSKIPVPEKSQSSLWVTRQRPKIDRIACPWLIRRFVDPDARFLFVASETVLDVAEKFNATPFDVPDVFWSHRGDTCSFDTMVEEFELSFDGLAKLATIVRAADTDRLDTVPEAAGLLAVSLGLSRMYKDDLQQLEAGMEVYDGFYRWCRDATDERHDWPGVPGKKSK